MNKRIGFTIPVRYVNDTAESEGDVLWSQILGDSKQGLSILKDIGVTSLELNPGKQALSEVELAIEKAFDFGFEVTIHGSLPEMDISTVPPALQKVSEVIKKHNIAEKIPVTVHSYKCNDSASIEEVSQQTVKGLENFANLLQEENSVLIPALEICRCKDQGPVGDNFDKVYEIGQKVGFDNVGLNWDIGHTHSNYCKFDHQPLPSLDFARKVIHTHIHTIGFNGRTHSFIGSDDNYVIDCINILKEVNYPGVYNFELYPIRWELSHAESRKNVEQTVNNLTKILDM